MSQVSENSPSKPPPTIWQSLREFGAIPLFFASIIGIGSTTELLQYFFGDLQLGDFLANWLDTWAFYNEKIRIVLGPVSDIFVSIAARFGWDVSLDPIWINFLWIFLLPGFGVMRLMKAKVPRNGRLDSAFYFLFTGSYALFALVLALCAGAYPSDESALSQSIAAVAPIVIAPAAAIVGVTPIMLLILVIETVLRGPIKAVGTVATGYWALWPGLKYLKVMIFGLVGISAPVYALVAFDVLEKGEGLAVYYFWLLILGIWLVARKPTKTVRRVAGQPDEINYSDTRPVGMFILGGFALTVAVLLLDGTIWAYLPINSASQG